MTEETQSVTLKRKVTVKTIVTQGFRDRAKSELGQEQTLLESQIQQLEMQYQQTVKQLETIAEKGQNVQQQMEQLNGEYQKNRAQLSSMKVQLTTQLASLERVKDGDMLTTGVLDNYISLSVGDDLYQKLGNAEMIVEDGLVKEIRA